MYHIYLLSSNQTTKEYVRWNKEGNPYDRGIWLNCWKVLGARIQKASYCQKTEDRMQELHNGPVAKYGIKDEIIKLKRVQTLDLRNIRNMHSIELTPTNNSGRFKDLFSI